MNQYTVVGTYEDNMQGYVDWINAGIPEKAAAIAMERADRGMLVIAVYAGHLQCLWHDPATEGI